MRNKDNRMTCWPVKCELRTHLMCLISATSPASQPSWEGRRRPSAAPLSGGDLARQGTRNQAKGGHIMAHQNMSFYGGIWGLQRKSLTDRHGSSQIGPVFSSFWSISRWGEIWDTPSEAKGTLIQPHQFDPYLPPHFKSIICNTISSAVFFSGRKMRWPKVFLKRKNRV